MLWWDLLVPPAIFVDRHQEIFSNMRKSLNLTSWLVGLCVPLVCLTQMASALEARVPWQGDLAEIRQVAGMIPGPRPLRVNVIKVAESRRTKNFAVKGLPAEPSVQARTAYQIVY